MKHAPVQQEWLRNMNKDNERHYTVYHAECILSRCTHGFFNKCRISKKLKIDKLYYFKQAIPFIAISKLLSTQLYQHQKMFIFRKTQFLPCE